MAKSLEDKLSLEGGSLDVDLARQNLEREASKHYKGYVVRSRLGRVPNEAIKFNMLTRGRRMKVSLSVYRISQILEWMHAWVKLCDVQRLLNALPYHFACCPDLLVTGVL